jgi:ABC-type sugar transport system permease subunit
MTAQIDAPVGEERRVPPRTRPGGVRGRAAPYLFLLPFFVVYACFLLYPIVSALDTSLYKKSGFGSPVFVGLENFRTLLSDDRFWHALLNTSLYALGTVFVLSPLALLLAVTLQSFVLRSERMRSFYRIALFLPNVTSLVVIAIMFSFLLEPRFGMANAVLGVVGVEPLNWLQSESTVLPSIVLIAIWTYLGLNSLYFLGGLQNIPTELYEAAALDGAGRIATFWRITVPLLRPTILFVAVQATIFSFQVFELPWLLTGGGPSDAALTLGIYLYQVGFVQFDQGYASAIGWAIALITLALTGIQLFLYRVVADDQ